MALGIASYISPKVNKGAASQIQGRGLIARAPIARGEIVAIKGGHIVDSATYATLDEQLRNSDIQITDDFHIVALDANEYEAVMLFLNHSCEPNVGIAGNVVFVAMRDIEVGEELTTDYALFDDNDGVMTCRCGRPTCRHIVAGNDWRRPELQAKYAGYFSWYLQQRFTNSSPPPP
jgi:SET domain-containing protein